MRVRPLMTVVAFGPIAYAPLTAASPALEALLLILARELNIRNSSHLSQLAPAEAVEADDRPDLSVLVGVVLGVGVEGDILVPCLENMSAAAAVHVSASP